MRVTIGEVMNSLLPYCSTIETSMFHHFPFLRAVITSNDCARCFMYVKQLEEHIYAVCDSSQDSNGQRYFPTGSISKPFIIEQDLVKSWFGASYEDHPDWYEGVQTDLDYTAFLRYLFQCLLKYDILSISDKTLSTAVSDIGFTSIKIKRSIDRAMKEQGFRIGTIQDLIDLVYIQQKQITFTGLKPKELQILSQHLRLKGISVEMEDKTIHGIKLV